MAKKRTTKKQIKKAKQQVIKAHAEIDLSDDYKTADDLTAKSIPIIQIAIREVLNGTQGYAMRDIFRKRGHDVGIERTYQLIKVAKLEIVTRARRDLDENFAWIQENLVEMFSDTKKTKDARLGLLVLKELKDLWGLNNLPPKADDKEITPEMIQQFTQVFLR
jgi:phosphopantothenoylcysteine synthetase/decarboxylase